MAIPTDLGSRRACLATLSRRVLQWTTAYTEKLSLFLIASRGWGRDYPKTRAVSGAQAGVGARWCISGAEYIMASDPWSLNPDGKLLLGVKVRWQCARVKESRNHIGIGVEQQRSQSIPELREPPYPSLEIRSVLYFFVVIIVGNKATWQVTNREQGPPFTNRSSVWPSTRTSTRFMNQGRPPKTFLSHSSPRAYPSIQASTSSWAKCLKMLAPFTRSTIQT